MLEDNLEDPSLSEGKDNGKYSPTANISLSCQEPKFVTIIFLLLYLPFINKAFHIDDYCFIKMSAMTGWNPLHAIPVDYDFAGMILPKTLPYESPHPHLIPYIIKIITDLFGVSEIGFHLAFMIFPLIALFSLMKLNAVLFTNYHGNILILGVFFCSLPAFMVNAQNIMTDVPSLSFLLLAMACFFDSFESGSQRMTWLGSAALTLAVFSSYQMLAFVVILFLYALLRRKLTFRMATAISLPMFILLVWLLVIYEMYGVFPIVKSKLSFATASIGGMVKQGLVPKNMLKKMISGFAFTGAGIIWVLPLYYALKKNMGRFLLMLSALSVVSYLVVVDLTINYKFGTLLFLSVLVSLGVLTLITLMNIVWKRVKEGGDAGRDIFLLVWVFCVIGYCIILLPFGAARYILPAFPPMLMLLLSDPVWSKTRRIVVYSVLGCAVLFALMSAFADYKYADSYRDFVEKTKTSRASGRGLSNVWYIGEWGMHYYMEKAGAHYLYADSNGPLPGDYVVVSEMSGQWAPSKQLQTRLMFFSEHAYKSWLPLRLFNNRSNSGFYCQAYGMLPFAFSNEMDEVFLIYKVMM